MAAIILLEDRRTAHGQTRRLTTEDRRPRRARQAEDRRAPAAAKAAPEPSVDDIRRRAYERYLERGGEHGQHFDDWVAAEAELRSKKSEVKRQK